MLFSIERFDSFPVIADMSFVSFHVSSRDNRDKRYSTSL